MRRVYKLLLQMHPKAFRERFGAEMLCIFEDGVETEGAFGMLLDGIVSLLRQRIFRSHGERSAVRMRAVAPEMFTPLTLPQQTFPFKMSRLILGGAISFGLF